MLSFYIQNAVLRLDAVLPPAYSPFRALQGQCLRSDLASPSRAQSLRSWFWGEHSPQLLREGPAWAAVLQSIVFLCLAVSCGAGFLRSREWWGQASLCGPACVAAEYGDHWCPQRSTAPIAPCGQVLQTVAYVMWQLPLHSFDKLIRNSIKLYYP